MNPKQIIVMRTDLNMRKGKMIAQGSHASMKVFFDRIPTGVREAGIPEGFVETSLPITVDRPMVEWVFGAFTKVCLQVSSEEELLDVYERAQKSHLPCALIVDSGKTEFHGIPTKTCCAIGPANPSDIDNITRHLKLL